jgi:hypothetical protein
LAKYHTHVAKKLCGFGRLEAFAPTFFLASHTSHFGWHTPCPGIAAYSINIALFLNPQVVPCNKRYVHDWTECPFAHPQEKARRRDPARFSYTGIACPSMKKARLNIKREFSA